MIYIRKQKELRVKNKVTPASFPSITVKWSILPLVFLHSLHLITPISGLSHPKSFYQACPASLGGRHFEPEVRLYFRFSLVKKFHEKLLKLGLISGLNQVQAHQLRVRGRYPGPGLSNPLAGRVAAILNNLFKQVRAHRLGILHI